MDFIHSQKLKRYLEDISPGSSIEGLAEEVLPAATLEGTSSDRLHAESGIKKLATHQTLTPTESFALEAIIIPDKRPVVNIVEDDFTVTQSMFSHYSSDISIKSRLIKAIPSIGRIELPEHPSLPYGGTGFIVGDGILMTNRHVAEIFSTGLGVKNISFQSGAQAGVDFKQEHGNSESHLFTVREVLMIHPYWDMALLSVEERFNLPSPLLLSQMDPEELEGQEIAVIGYPAFDFRNNAEVQDRVFSGVYNVKRLQPGKLTSRGEIRSFGKMVDAVKHDSSTLGGNSGSAVIDVATGQVVALHFAGRYLEANYAVPSSELARDMKVVDFGLNFTGPSIASSTSWDQWWNMADPEGLQGNDRVASPTYDTPVSHISGPKVDEDRDSASWTIPFEISVRIPGRTRAVSSGNQMVRDVGSDDGIDIEKMVEPFHDFDYTNRKGFDRDFLGIPMDLPIITDNAILAKLEDGAHIIPYHHFSVIMHKIRRLALVTASNVDGRLQIRKPDPTKKYNRKALGGLRKNDRERWFTDPRIPAIHQLPDRFFTKDRGAFDKGHIVRRDDVAWGNTYRELRFANGDTFHTTNCSPQVSGFNRPDHDDNWGELEKFILKQAKTERLNVLAGPVLSDNDRHFTGTDEKGIVDVQIPSKYWKVAVAANDDRFEVFAFLLEQDLSSVDLELRVTPKWIEHMVSVGDLENRVSGFRFPQKLHHADQRHTEIGESLRRTFNL